MLLLPLQVRIAEVHSLKSEKNKLLVFDGQQSIINLANKTFEKVTKKNCKLVQQKYIFWNFGIYS